MPANSTISPVMTFWHNPATDKMDVGLDKAQAMLKAAGYSVDSSGQLHYPDGTTETVKN